MSETPAKTSGGEIVRRAGIVAAGTVLGLLLFPDFDVWDAALLAAVLTPTDAALGQAVVSSPVVPERIRQALNVESGLNDGLAVPVVAITLAVAASTGDRSGGDWAQFVAEQIGFGVAVGVAAGSIGWVLERAVDKGITSEGFDVPAIESRHRAYTPDRGSVGRCAVS